MDITNSLNRKLRILWFTNILMPDLSKALGRKQEVVGGWMSSLLGSMSKLENVEIAVATILPGANHVVEHHYGHVTYYGLPLKKTRGMKLSPKFVSACQNIISSFAPDIIHVHGTEDVYGLYTASRTIPCPTVVSIQGLIHVYCHHVRGGGWSAYAGAGKEGVFAYLRFLIQELHWHKRGIFEKKNIAGNKFFIGRTEWDKAHLLAVNPLSRYYHCNETLRSAFYSVRWDIKEIKRQTIFCTAAHSPLKGFHWLLFALSMLRKEFPEVNIRVAGAPWDSTKGYGFYGRYIKRLIDKHKLNKCITPLKMLTAEEVAAELRSAHVVVIPSLIENSPNSLAEAMLVGTPSVASFVGGIPSMVTDQVDALCVQPGDAACLAHKIRQLFLDDSLAVRLSKNTRERASERHNPDTVVENMMNIYYQLTENNEVANSGG